MLQNVSVANPVLDMLEAYGNFQNVAAILKQRKRSSFSNIAQKSINLLMNTVLTIQFYCLDALKRQIKKKILFLIVFENSPLQDVEITIHI